MKKKISTFLIIVLCVASFPISAFAIENANNPVMDITVNAMKESMETLTGRHYNVSEEIVADRLDNVYLYPSDVYLGQPDEDTALKRVYVEKERHYKVYRVRVGDPNNRVFLYDKYVGEWEGQWRLAATTNVWHTDPMYPMKERTSIERQPWLQLFEGYGLDE